MKTTTDIKKTSSINLILILVPIAIYAFLTLITDDNTSSNTGLIIKGLAMISMIFPVIKLAPIYSKYFTFYIFCIPNFWWVKEIERPRLVLNIFGIILIFGALKILSEINSDMNNFNYAIYSIASLLLYLLAAGLIIISWTHFFEKSLVPKIRKKLHTTSDIKCIINEKEYNIDKIFNDINTLEFNKTGELEDNHSTFIALINLEQVEPENRIKSSLEKTTLIRLTYILFNLDVNIKPEQKALLINTYFMNDKGDNIIPKGEPLFARIDNEIIDNKDIIINYKKQLLSVFQSNKRM